jgi:signal peptidase I
VATTSKAPVPTHEHSTLNTSTHTVAKDKDKKKGGGRPWRENIEAIAVSVIVIVLFKYFVLEAYKIPTGSMQPTLMGWDDGKGGGVFDRVVVDKLSYRFRDPKRWEIAVFRYPLDTSKNFIKRLVGMPGEHLKIENGDLWTRPSEEDPWVILRRPPRLQDVHFKSLGTTGDWKENGTWSHTDDGLMVSGPGSARFPRTRSAVVDRYTDGYPGDLVHAVKPKPSGSGRNKVGDLRLSTTLTADTDCTLVRLELLDGPYTYALEIPGPAAAPTEKARVIVADAGGKWGQENLFIDGAFSLADRDELEIQFQNLDDLLEVQLDGEVLFTLEVPPVARHQMSRSGVQLITRDGGAHFDELQVARDVFYTDDQKVTSWKIPEDSYVALGDNTQDSSDGRDWTLLGYKLDDGRELWGNQRSRENPLFAHGMPGGPQIFFRDQLGERHMFMQEEALPLPPRPLSFVPRNLVRGRAVAVVWPAWSSSYGLSRFQWCR